VKDLSLKEQDTPMKEQNRHLKVKGHQYWYNSPPPAIPSEAKHKRTNWSCGCSLFYWKLLGFSA